MTTLGRLCVLIGGLSLAACAGGNVQEYEAPLKQAGYLGAEPEAGKPKRELPEVSVSGTGEIQSFAVDNRRYGVSSLRPGRRPAIESDEAGLWMMMDNVERRVRTSGYVIDDEELTSYVQEIACRLAGDYCDDIRVYIVENPQFNATMAPNGMMHVWTGLLLRMRNEAQLAAILGHELGHYMRRHSLKMMQDVIAKTNALVLVQLATAAAGVPTVGDAASVLTSGSIYAFSRDNEREADGFGLLLMIRGGYDPRQAAKVWSQLLREYGAGRRHSGAGIFSTHPQSSERQVVLAQVGERLYSETGSSKLGRQALMDVLLPRRAALLQSELNRREFEQTDVLLDMLLEDGENPAELHFFKGENYRLRAQEGDDRLALRHYETAANAAGRAPPQLHRSLGLIHYRLGNDADAARAFEIYLEVVPDSEDRLMIEDLIRRLTTS